MPTRKISFATIITSLLVGFFLGFGVQQRISYLYHFNLNVLTLQLNLVTDDRSV